MGLGGLGLLSLGYRVELLGFRVVQFRVVKYRGLELKVLGC